MYHPPLSTAQDLVVKVLGWGLGGIARGSSMVAAAGGAGWLLFKLLLQIPNGSIFPRGPKTWENSVRAAADVGSGSIQYGLYDSYHLPCSNSRRDDTRTAVETTRRGLFDSRLAALAAEGAGRGGGGAQGCGDARGGEAGVTG